MSLKSFVSLNRYAIDHDEAKPPFISVDLSTHDGFAYAYTKLPLDADTASELRRLAEEVERAWSDYLALEAQTQKVGGAA